MLCDDWIAGMRQNDIDLVQQARSALVTIGLELLLTNT